MSTQTNSIYVESSLQETQQNTNLFQQFKLVSERFLFSLNYKFWAQERGVFRS